MKIRRESPSDKLDYRINAPLGIEIAGETYRTRDWSLEGFTVANFSALQGSNVPIVGLVSSITPELEDEALGAGMVSLQVKPIKKLEFIELLRSFVRRIDGNTPSLALEGVNVMRMDADDLLKDTGEEVAASEESAGAPSRGVTQRGDGDNAKRKKILIVICNPAQRAVYTAYAQNMPEYAIDIVDSCMAAVLRSDEVIYDLVLLEMNDPKMRGREAAQRIRTREGFNIGDEFQCRLSLPFQGFGIDFPVRARVDGFTTHGELNASFLQLNERQGDILSFFAEELIRGSMTVIDDVILHLDRPIELVSQKPDESAPEVASASKISPKLVLMSMAYILIGLVVVGYAYLTVNSNFLQLEIEAAVVAAPLEPMRATSDGRLAQIPVGAGELVRPDTVVMAIEDPKLDEEIERARIRVESLQSELLSKRSEFLAERDRYSSYRNRLQSRVAQAEQSVATLERRTQIALRQRNRFAQLLARGHTTKSKFDETADAYTEIAGLLTQARLTLSAETEKLTSLSKTAHYEGKGRIRELAAGVELYSERIVLSQREQAALENRKRRLMLRAPKAGRILRLLRTSGSTVKRGEELALFERDEPRTVVAYLLQNEVVQIGLGDEALVFFPSLDVRVQGRVEAIDRTEGFVDEARAKYSWRGVKDRSARVTLSILNKSHDEIRQSFPPGLPAVVIFDRRDTNEIREQWKSIIKDVFTAPFHSKTASSPADA